MELYRVIYFSGNIIWKTSLFMSLEECVAEANRFNSLPLLDLERQAMTARVQNVEVK